MDKNKRLLEFPLMDEFAVNLKMNLELPDPFNKFKLLFPNKKTSEMHQATITNLNALVLPQIYVPTGLNLNMAKLNLMSGNIKPSAEDLTPEEEDLLEIPRSKKPSDIPRREPLRPHPYQLKSAQGMSGFPSGEGPLEAGLNKKRSFEEFSEFMDGLDEYFRRPQDVLDSLQQKLKDIFTRNITHHMQIARTEIAQKIPESTVTHSHPVTVPTLDYFPGEKVIQSTVNLLSKGSKIEAPDMSMITVGEDNHKILNFYKKSETEELYEKTREFVIYVPGDHQRRATGVLNNLFYLDEENGNCVVTPMDFSVDIRKENRTFPKETKRIDDDFNLVTVEADKDLNGTGDADEEGSKIAEPVAESKEAREHKEPPRETPAPLSEKEAMEVEAQSSLSDDSLDQMIIE